MGLWATSLLRFLNEDKFQPVDSKLFQKFTVFISLSTLCVKTKKTPILLFSRES